MNTTNHPGPPDDAPSAHPAQSLHRRAWNLIPWVAAGSATAAASDWVQAHAAGCADCRDELAFHRALATGMRADAPDAASTHHDPGPALQRLLHRIDVAESAAADAQAPEGPSTPRTKQPPRAAQRNTWLVAAVLVQGVGLATLVGVLLERPRVADYSTMSQSNGRPSQASIRLVPAPGMTVGELQAMLARLELNVVETSADGALLGLAPRPGGRVGTSQALSELRADPDVLLAEPIHDPRGAQP